MPFFLAHGDVDAAHELGHDSLALGNRKYPSSASLSSIVTLCTFTFSANRNVSSAILVVLRDVAAPVIQVAPLDLGSRETGGNRRHEIDFGASPPNNG